MGTCLAAIQAAGYLAYPGDGAMMVTALPARDDMPEQDKGAALRFLWMRARNGARPAATLHPVQYTGHPALRALGISAACRHAVQVTGGRWADVVQRIGFAEADRLSSIAAARAENLPAGTSRVA